MGLSDLFSLDIRERGRRKRTAAGTERHQGGLGQQNRELLRDNGSHIARRAHRARILKRWLADPAHASPQERETALSLDLIDFDSMVREFEDLVAGGWKPSTTAELLGAFWLMDECRFRGVPFRGRWWLPLERVQFLVGHPL